MSSEGRGGGGGKERKLREGRERTLSVSLLPSQFWQGKGEKEGEGSYR